MNDIARTISGPVELTERAYVQMLYVIQRASTTPGWVKAFGERRIPARIAGMSVSDQGVWFEPWDQLAHLDDVHPDLSVWPKVTPARPRAFTRVDALDALLARRYVEQQGRPIEVAAAAAVTPLIPNRPTIGAVRRQAQRDDIRVASSTTKADSVMELQHRVERITDAREAKRRSHPPAISAPAPISLVRDLETRDRWDRLCWDLRNLYCEMWSTEQPSDDIREQYDMYRDEKPKWPKG